MKNPYQIQLKNGRIATAVHQNMDNTVEEAYEDTGYYSLVYPIRRNALIKAKTPHISDVFLTRVEIEKIGIKKNK